jgi:PleD family two-component response regulator
MAQKVIAVTDDLFFASKIRATAQAVNVQLNFVRGLDQLITSAAESKPDLIVIDLHSQKIDALSLAHSLKSSDDLKSIPLVGFFSHVETELQRSALEAGFDRVIPRSLFSRDLAIILKGVD